MLFFREIASISAGCWYLPPLHSIVQQLSKKEKLKRVHRYSSIVLTSQHGVLDGGGCNVETETLFTVLSPLWSL